MTNLDSIFKNRDITLPTKVHLVKAMVFPVVMYGCESWTVKKAEHQRIDAFELWCWRRLLSVPWTARRSNQSILKEISPGCSLEGMMLKLKLQYFGHLMWRRADSLEETDAGRDWGQEEKGTTEDEMAGWHHQLEGREFEWTPGVGDGQEGLACCDSWGRKESDTEQLNWSPIYFCFFSHYSRRWVKKDLAVIYVKECCSAYVFLKEFCSVWPCIRSLIHFEFIFVYGVRKCSNFSLLHVHFSQHHLLKRLPSLHCIFLPPLSKIRGP